MGGGDFSCKIRVNLEGGASRGQISSHLAKSATQLLGSNQQLPICGIFCTRPKHLGQPKSGLDQIIWTRSYGNCATIHLSAQHFVGVRLASEGERIASNFISCVVDKVINMNRYNRYKSNYYVECVIPPPTPPTTTTTSTAAAAARQKNPDPASPLISLMYDSR